MCSWTRPVYLCVPCVIPDPKYKCYSSPRFNWLCETTDITQTQCHQWNPKVPRGMIQSAKKRGRYGCRILYQPSLDRLFWTFHFRTWIPEPDFDLKCDLLREALFTFGTLHGKLGNLSVPSVRIIITFHRGGNVAVHSVLVKYVIFEKISSDPRKYRC